MDPFLEHPSLWPGVHNALIAHLQAVLGPALRPSWFVCLQERTVEPSAPQAAPCPIVEVEVPVSDQVRETWLEVRPAGGGEVVTVLEILSPTNKRPGRGRRVYEAKRRLVLDTATSLIEIDLLRNGEPMPLRGPHLETDYRVLISRGDRRPRADLLPFSVQDPIPTFELPLRPGERGPVVDLRAALDSVYGNGSFDLRLDYRQEPVPPLAGDTATWADALLRAAGLRS